MRAGPARSSAAEALRGAGYRVRTAREPYEGTARFVERPTDLVVLSLAGFRKRDSAFLATVKRRMPTTRVLLLVPEGRRRTALEALQAGADAYALEPFYPAELTALAAALLSGRDDGQEDDTARALGRLAGEVAHAINNPLQILALLGEAADVSLETRDALGQEVSRIQGVMRILSRFGLLRRPQRGAGPLGYSLCQSLEAAEAEGRIQTVGEPPADGPALSIDSSQTGVAFDTMLQFLAARAPEQPVEVAARVRVLPAGRPDSVEAAVRGIGVQLDRDALRALRQAVLLNRDDTREPYPGLALAEAVARNHGGRFVARASEHGVTLALRLPLA
ncbi:MAG: hypothetical protein O2894_11260 [Planctomycetota bacterium]|nr:hypothetical protein [Planctomycetota bacterium]